MNPDYWKQRYGFGTKIKPRKKPKDDREPKNHKRQSFRDKNPDLYDKELISNLKSKLISLYGESCMKCGSTERVVVDHIKSRCVGGTNEFENLQLLCWKCNKRKGSRKVENYKPY